MKYSRYSHKTMVHRLLLASMLWLATAPSGMAEDAPRINLQDVEIRQLVDIVAKDTGKNFIVDPQVRGKITFVSGRGLDKSGLGADEILTFYSLECCVSMTTFRRQPRRPPRLVLRPQHQPRRPALL